MSFVSIKDEIKKVVDELFEDMDVEVVLKDSVSADELEELKVNLEQLGIDLVKRDLLRQIEEGEK
tara:strand:- start:39 stop:233 length:195 start_codon:yes stop_codon:yes gene_type:complete